MDKGEDDDQAIEPVASDLPQQSAESSVNNSSSLDTDNTLHEQGVDVGKGWLRYWDAQESEHYYYHSGNVLSIKSYDLT